MENSENINNLRHSCAHLLAAAVLELWPKTKRAIGPPIEYGFYYDFDFEAPVSEEDLPKIEKRMLAILKTWQKFEKEEITKEEAIKRFNGNPYKEELIEELTKKGEKLTVYKIGDFEDLCRGGHSQNPGEEIKVFKLLKIAGAYWRGSEKNKMLTRIYGTCFKTKKELDRHLELLGAAKKRDHKKLGAQLNLFFFHETSPGMPYWLPGGLEIYNQLLKFNKSELKKRGYSEVATPILNKKSLYEISGHYEHYWEDMFVAKMDKDEEYGIKAMNCPNAMIIYQRELRSYRDLPLRLADTDTLHRYELSGVLNGLLRAREFRQDDAHIFATEEQLEEEIKDLLDLVKTFYGAFNLKYSFRLGTKPKSFLGEVKSWEKAQNILITILDKSTQKYTVEEGEGAFYGPKIDILMEDALKRKWQMGTIQLDPNQTKRFNLKYTDQNGDFKTPYVIHRAILGSLERFIGILTEHFEGKFPTWLAPTQAIILPISEKVKSYAQNIEEKLDSANIRVTLDLRNETLQAKIRDATLQKIPYLLIVGPKEEQTNKVSVRNRDGLNLGPVSLDKFIKETTVEIESKKI